MFADLTNNLCLGFEILVRWTDIYMSNATLPNIPTYFKQNSTTTKRLICIMFFCKKKMFRFNHELSKVKCKSFAAELLHGQLSSVNDQKKYKVCTYSTPIGMPCVKFFCVKRRIGWFHAARDLKLLKKIISTRCTNCSEFFGNRGLPEMKLCSYVGTHFYLVIIFSSLI